MRHTSYSDTPPPDTPPTLPPEMDRDEPEVSRDEPREGPRWPRDEPEMATSQASIFTWADSGEPITGNPQPKRSNASSEKHCKCHGGSPNTPVGGYCYNLPGYGTKPACTKKSELPPSIYKLALDIAQGKTRSWNATSAVRPADLEADYAFLYPEPALESVTRLPLYSTVFSCQHCTRSLCTLTRCSEHSHGTRYRAPPLPDLLVHSTRRLTASAARRIEALCPLRRAPDTHDGGCQRAGSALLTTSS